MSLKLVAPTRRLATAIQIPFFPAFTIFSIRRASTAQ
jgi:hypothetical protein